MISAPEQTTPKPTIESMDDNGTDTTGRNSEHTYQGPQISTPRLALRSFTSQWFLVPQGTGILAVILHQLRYHFHGLAIISQCVWVLTIVMLTLALLAYTARALLYSGQVTKLLRQDMMETACLARISIAFTTVIQMTALNLVEAWGSRWGMVVYVLWWINLSLAATACVGIVYVFTGMEASGVDHAPVAIRLPPIAILTAAAGGGVVCRYGELDADLQIPVIIVSYLCVGAGVLLALMCDAAFVQLFDQSWPRGRRIFSVMIACGPYGQSKFLAPS